MNFHKNQKLKMALASILMLALLGCTVATVLQDVQFAVNVVSAAAPIIAPFAGPGAVVIAGYVTAAANGLNCALDAAEMPGATTATISTAVVGCLSNIVVPALPAGTPSIIAGVVTAIASQIANLLQKYGVHPGLAQAAPVKMKLGMADHRAVKNMHKQLNAALATLATKK